MRRVHPAIAAATLLLVATAAGLAGAEPMRSLGSLEREAVDEALVERGLTIDLLPMGKVIGRIHVVNQDVFTPRDGRFQALNVLHRTTRPDAVARELLLGPGQPWNEALVDECIRNLQTQPPLFFADSTLFGAPQVFAIVALAPVVSAVPGTVDLLVVTRDVWSLRFNTEFAFQKDRLSLLRTSISENNLFGWRKQLAAGFELDQGRLGIGPTYFDPNVAGTRLTLLAKANAWYARDAERYEGDNEVVSLRYPLYALAQRWGAGIDVRHQNTVVRSFCDDQLCPAAVAGTSVPLAYRFRTLAADASVVRAFGQKVVQRLTAGYRILRQRPLVLDGFPGDPGLAEAFLGTWAPQAETRSEPYLRYELFTATYGLFHELNTFDLRENSRLGPLLTVELGAGLPELGADFAAYPMSATASWTAAPAGTGYAVAQVQASARARSGQLIDRRVSGLLYFVLPNADGAPRVVMSAVTDAVAADTYRTRFFMGGDTGLRGYQIGEFQGTVQAAFHTEIRSAPVGVYSQRLGGVLFYDVGGAASSYRALGAHHDVGVGLRWLIPQLNSSVLRIDWAVATQDGPYTRSGLPGRITAGFMQSFWLLDSPKGYLPSY